MTDDNTHNPRPEDVIELLRDEDVRDRRSQRRLGEVRVVLGVIVIGVALLMAGAALIAAAWCGNDAPEWATATVASIVTAAVAYIFSEQARDKN